MKTGRLVICLLLCIITINGCTSQPERIKPTLPVKSSMLNLDYRKLISRADLNVNGPVSCSDAGLPIGNGTMGSLVWTSPTTLKFQINRVDVFANDGSTSSFDCHEDYCCGCGFVDIDFNAQVFTNTNQTSMQQHLSVYDGLATLQAGDIKIEVLAWHERDVMVIQIDDQRQQPTGININLRALRPPVVETNQHTATSRLNSLQNRIMLTQEFVEDNFLCRSAVAIGLKGRQVDTQRLNDTTVQLKAQAGQGHLTIFIASAATFDPDEDIIDTVLKTAQAATVKGYQNLRRANLDWWHDFWSKSFIHLTSRDSTADFVERYYTYFLYLMGCTSQGKYPPKFNGTLWVTRGDPRAWGALYWWWNTQTAYRMPFPANHLELMQPLFDMYSNMYEASARAAQQQWGSQGIFIPETVPFNGLEELPEDIARELRDYMLERKTFSQTSKKFQDYAMQRHSHCSRWNFLHGRTTFKKEASEDPYSFVVHIFSSSAKLAYLYWLYYEYTGDEDWLRERAYPMLKGVTEFYRNYPNVKKGADGKYHIYNVNNHETLRRGQDTIEEVMAMHAVTAMAIRASTILKVDTDLRHLWQEFLQHLTPLPTSDDPDATVSTRDIKRTIWAAARKPCQTGGGGSYRPCMHYDFCTLETTDQRRLEISHNTFFYNWQPRRYPTWHSFLSEAPIGAAIMGRADVFEHIVPGQYRLAELANRLSENYGNHPTQGYGLASYALQLGLCQSVAPEPAGDTVIRVFSAWPEKWDAAFTLLCRGGFLVTSSIQQGRIDFVEILSQLGGECRLRNPWGEVQVSLYEDGSSLKDIMSGSLLKFNTEPGERIVIVRQETRPADFRRTITPLPLPVTTPINELVNSLWVEPIDITMAGAQDKVMPITVKNPFKEKLTVDLSVEIPKDSKWSSTEKKQALELSPGQKVEVSLPITFHGDRLEPRPYIKKAGWLGKQKILNLSQPLPFNLQRTLHINKIDSPIKIDGQLDEPAWQPAQDAGPWLVHDSHHLTDIKTVWRAGYDDQNLYLAFDCREDRMDQLRQTEKIRDWQTLESDCLFVYLSVFEDHNPRFCFGVNAFGKRMDYRAFPDEHFDQKERDWNPDWPVKVHRGSDRYTVEMAIPFDILGVDTPTAGTEWRINAHRKSTLDGGVLTSWSRSAGALGNPGGYGTALFH